MLELFGRILRSPLFIPSGIIGIEQILEKTIDLSGFGFVVLKTITVQPRTGNSGIRIWELPCGLVNSIGLPNVGLDKFLTETAPMLKDISLPFIISISPASAADILKLAELQVYCDLAIEINLSCPNVGDGKRGLISQNAQETYQFLKLARREIACPIIAKLSPDVTFISDIAKAAEDAGCDGLSLVNTFQAVVIDVVHKRPVFDRVVAGLSGPAILGLSIKRIWDVYSTVSIPILGVGGVFDFESCLQMTMAGARVVGIGSSLYRRPDIGLQVFKKIEVYLDKNQLNWQDLVGIAHGVI